MYICIINVNRSLVRRTSIGRGFIRVLSKYLSHVTYNTGGRVYEAL